MMKVHVQSVFKIFEVNSDRLAETKKEFQSIQGRKSFFISKALTASYNNVDKKEDYMVEVAPTS